MCCIIKQNMKSIYDCFGYCLVKTRDRRRIDCVMFEIRWCRYSSCRRRDVGRWCTWVYVTTDCESSLYKAAADRRWTKTGKHCLPQHTLPQSSDNCHWTLSGESCECISLDSNEQYLVLWCCLWLWPSYTSVMLIYLLSMLHCTCCFQILTILFFHSYSMSSFLDPLLDCWWKECCHSSIYQFCVIEIVK